MQYKDIRRRVFSIFEGLQVYLGGFETSFTFTHVPVVPYKITKKNKLFTFQQHPPADTRTQPDKDFYDKLHYALGPLSYRYLLSVFRIQIRIAFRFNQVSGRGSKRPKRIPTKIEKC
jgi:hypothetical protein